MTESIESLVIEHLRHIRGRVDQIASDESHFRLQANFDRLIERIQQDERRLELS